MMLVYVPEKIHSCDQKQQIDLCCCQIVGFKKLSSTETELNFFYFIAYVLSESPNNFDAPRPFQSPVSHINIPAECSCAKYISELIFPFLKGKANNVSDQTLHFCSSKIRHSKLELSGATDNFCKFVRTAYGVM